MKKFLKLVSTTLVIASVTVIILSGCAGSKADTGNTSSSSASVTSTTSGNTPYDLDVYYPNWGSPLDDLSDVQTEMNKILNAKINASVILHPIDGGGWADKVNLMNASGDKIDVISSSAGLLPVYADGVARGSYLPIDDLLAKYGSDIINACGADYLKGTAINGKEYGVPVLKEKGSTYGYVFNKTIVDKYKYDLSSIKTYKDIEPMLKDIKEKEPGITPLCLSGRTMAQLSNTLSVQVDNFDVGILPCNTTDYKVIDWTRYQPFVDLINWTRQMYLAGYINKSCLTDSDEGPMKAGKAFCMPYELKPGKDLELSSAWGFTVEQVELCKPYMPSNQALGIMMSIGKTSENPECAMQFINLLFADKQLLNTLVFGVENKHYVKVSDNTIDYPKGVDAKTVGYANQGWLFGNQFNDYLMSNEDPQKWDKFQKFNSEVVKSPVLGFTFDKSQYQTESAAISSIDMQYRIAIWTGSVDPAKALTEYRDKLKKAGFEKVLQGLQDQLTEWVKTNK